MAFTFPNSLLVARGINGYSACDHAVKEQFHRDGRAFCRALAKALELPMGSYDIRSNKGGPAVSGEITLHHENLYVQLFESCINARGVKVMYRTCKGRKDYTGGNNNFAHLGAMQTADARALFLNACRQILSTQS